ncbi:metal transporter [Paraferrimonas haliotis]|uniref:Metal transporter n=1 Tax=Paraferrimonas haliotis TaxID=2013866 RepID=A0AA37TK72_9GAMM|nr:metal transporter [Paraferrimonas haliotis]GLS82078.1 metal transporter [Paraferrimonas haliotis]
MTYLVATCVSLLLGPLFYRFFGQQNGITKAIDGFVFVTLGGLLLTHILPEMLHHGGIAALAMILLGLFGPTVSERAFAKHSQLTHNITVLLAFFGLLLHTFIDGTSISISTHDDAIGAYLPIGIILHRLPEGLAIWWLLSPQFGNRWASVAIAAMLTATVAGFGVGELYANQLAFDNTVLLQAFVTGSILHVILHQPHVDKNHHPQPSHDTMAGIGSLLGLALLFVLFTTHSHGGHEHLEHSSVEQLWQLMLTLAPYVVLTYIIGAARFGLGMLSTQSSGPAAWIQRLMGPEGLILVAIVLGWQLASFQLVAIAVIVAWLSHQSVPLDSRTEIERFSLRQFALQYQIERSAPWVLLSLVLANLMTYPDILADKPWLQLLLIVALLLPMRFCFIGAAVLSISLALTGWSSAAVMLPLLAAPLLNVKQLSKMSGPQGAITMALVLALVVIGSQSLPSFEQHAAPIPYLSPISLVILALLFASTLLRIGPRAFIANLFAVSLAHKHHHHH